MIETLTSPHSPHSPLWRRLGAWAGERFPARNGVLVLVVWAVGVLFGRAITHRGALDLPAIDWLAFPALWAYFLLLRVFDEHKDYARDLHNHPDRVLQSGQITLGHLKALGWAAAAVPLAVSLVIDHGVGPVTALWAALIVWTLLMAKEFFVEWPPERFLLYAFMHMLSMPLTLLWLAQIGAGGATLPAAARWLALLGGFVGAALEVARKFRAPADERMTIDTYTGELGVRGASRLLIAILLLAALTAAVLLTSAVTISSIVFLGFALAATPGVWATIRFAGEPTASRADIVELSAALTVLAILVLAIVALLAARGLG